MAPKKVFSRLPTSVSPKKYTLDYNVIDLDNYIFKGEESVHIVVNSTTKEIVFHAVDLWIRNVKLNLHGDCDATTAASVLCEEITYNGEDQTVKLTLSAALTEGTEGTLSFDFEGILNDELRGFYRSEYTNITGEKRMMAVTQYEACDARRAFGCWDEPAIKSSYEVSMTTPADLVAISNTPVVRTEVKKTKSGTKKQWFFAETPIMSTYLVGMVVGEFDVVSDYTKEGVLVSVYTPQGHSRRGTFALDVATRALSYYAKIFGVEYPLQKLDMLAIPDFAAGAMENWGVVTYRETRLLIDEERSSIAQKTAVARTVCHELAHQWFGNLVTMEWWTSLWLNEGFARFMEFEAVNELFPQWRVWESFVQEITLGAAMNKDALCSSHAIEVEVNHPDEVDEIFDIISYAKGASIIRMLSSFLGRDTFYKGIHEYLLKYSYGNAKTKDLWNALESCSGKSITKMMDSWTLQKGFPVLSIVDDKSKDMKQEQLLLNNILSTHDKSSNSDAKWDVPLTFSVFQSDGTLKKAETCLLWAGKTENSSSVAQSSVSTQFNTLVQDADKGYCVNPDQSGFFLVNYSTCQWKNFETHVTSGALSTIDRLSLLHTSFTLSKNGYVDIGTAMKFALAYKNDDQYLIWKELTEQIRFYSSLFGQDMEQGFNKYISALFGGIYSSLGWKKAENGPEEAETHGIFRRSVIAMLGKVGHEGVLKEARRLFALYKENKATSGLSSDLRSVVFALVAKEGGQKEYDFFINLFEETDFIEERIDVLSSVGKIPCLALKKEYLNYGISSVRSQDVQYVFASVSLSSKEGANLAFEFLKENWTMLNQKYASYIVGRILSSVMSGLNFNKLDEVQTFMNGKVGSAFERSYSSGVERMLIKKAVFTRDEAAMKQFLDSFSS